MKLIGKGLKGSGYVQTCVMIIFAFMLFFVIFQFLNLWLTVTDVQKKISSAVISVSQANYENIFPCGREGYTGAFLFDDDKWDVSISSGDVYANLKTSLGIVNADGGYAKYAGEDVQYSIADLNVSAQGSRFRSAGITTENFEATTTFTLKVPIFFNGEALEPLKLNLSSKSNYSTKF